VAKALTAISVENYKPSSVRREIADAGCRGLYLVVQPTGRKSFAVRYRVNGKPKKLTLPKGTTLAAARAAATAALLEVEKAVDPSNAKRSEKRAQQELAANTFQAVAVLTAARRDEARELIRDEIQGGDWILPAARNKTKLDLVRRLSGAAQTIVEAQAGIDDSSFVFSVSGKKAIASLSRYKRDFDKACGVTGWTLHDLRRTARSLMSRAGISSDHAERCLGHVIGGVRETYDRHEYHSEKKRAYEALATLIERIVHPPGGNVRQLRG
jgi:integrase